MLHSVSGNGLLSMSRNASSFPHSLQIKTFAWRDRLFIAIFLYIRKCPHLGQGKIFPFSCNGLSASMMCFAFSVLVFIIFSSQFG